MSKRKPRPASTQPAVLAPRPASRTARLARVGHLVKEIRGLVRQLARG